MRLEKASYKALKYACLKFHYAKTVPITNISYSVFNKKNEWCGVICYGSGACPVLGKKYSLVSGQFLELTRMALNGKQESTSKAMAISIKLLKKHKPLVRLLISFADKGQKHFGIIYQATNWFFVDESKSSGKDIFYKGKWVHDRKRKHSIPKEQRLYKSRAGKYKYIYPLTKELKDKCLKLKKPYPKNASKA
mgnify:CR=1 FL=1